MKIYIASSEKHVGKIQEDIHIRNGYIKEGIYSEIATLKNIVRVAKSSDIVILKSIWGYHIDYKKFLKQISILKKKKVKLVNDYSFIYWNIDKLEYFNEIKNMNVISTNPLQIRHVKTALDIRNKITEAGKTFNTDKLVIKPSISEGGYLTFAYDINKENSSIISFLMANKNIDFMVQSYQSSIVEGEISVVIINGKLLYGIIRFPGVLTAKKDTRYLKSTSIPVSIKKFLSVLEDFFWGKFGVLPSICRVDFLKNNSGYEILEIELIDPDLFFRYISVSMREKTISTLLKLVKNL